MLKKRHYSLLLTIIKIATSNYDDILLFPMAFVFFNKNRKSSSHLCSSLFVSCRSIDLTSQKKALGAFHLQGRAQLSGTHKIVLHTIT